MRLPALNTGNPATALAASFERRPYSAALRARRPARMCWRSFAFIDGLYEWGWRYPQMPSWTVAPDLSNRWGSLRQLRLSARGGLAQCCQQAKAPGVYKLGSGGNPIRIEHRRQRQI